MDCPSCASKIETAVRKLPGVKDVQIDFIAGSLAVQGDSVDTTVVENEIARLGYKVARASAQQTPPTASLIDPAQRKEIVLVSIAALLVAVGGVLRWLDESSILAIASIAAGMAVGGKQMLIKGLKATANFRLDMDFLMTAAAIGAAALGEWTEAGTIVVLYALSELLEHLSVERSRRAARVLLNLAPRTAFVLNKGIAVQTPVEKVRIGAHVLVKPGGTIPVDGVVTAGSSAVNQASLTGESIPVDMAVGNLVLAGSINGSGALQIRAEKEPGDTTLARIIKMVEEAQRSKTKLQLSIEKFARYYTPAVVILAALVALIPPLFAGASWSIWIYRSLTLLMIGCPCALILATPITLVSAMTAAARVGVLVKGGRQLEGFGAIKAFAFDKTGTVTEGKLAVDRIEVLDGVPTAEMLRMAASVESHSEHPIAHAILKRADLDGLVLNDPSDFLSLTGRGASARLNGQRIFVGNHALFEERGLCDGRLHHILEEVELASRTAMLVGTDDGVIGLIGVSDQVRPEANEVIRDLKAQGAVQVVLLTGDNHRTALAVGKMIGADEVKSELLPDQKIETIVRLKNEYGSVAMIGDGVNDAPALAMADVGVAVGRVGADVAVETADVVLLNGNLSRLPWLYKLSQDARRTVKMNIGLALGVKGAFLVLAMTGTATLWMALFADTGVALLVVGNGLRMLKR